MQYLAADYEKHGGEKGSYYQSYLDLLEKWIENGAPKKVQLIHGYVKRGRVIADLVAHGILFSDQRNRLFNQRPDEKDKKVVLDIFDLLPGRIDQKTGKLLSWQADAFVRWQVEIPDDPRSAVWNDPEIIQSWAGERSLTSYTAYFKYGTNIREGDKVVDNYSRSFHVDRVGLDTVGYKHHIEADLEIL